MDIWTRAEASPSITLFNNGILQLPSIGFNCHQIATKLLQTSASQRPITNSINFKCSCKLQLATDSFIFVISIESREWQRCTVIIVLLLLLLLLLLKWNGPYEYDGKTRKQQFLSVVDFIHFIFDLPPPRFA